MSLSGLPPQRVACASGLFNFMRMLAGGFGASLSVAIRDQRQALHDARFSAVAAPHNPFTEQTFTRLGELGMSAKASLGELAHVISQQSFMLATNDFFWLSGWVFLALQDLVWFARGPSRILRS